MNRLRLTILRHNVQTWHTKRHALTNIYNDLVPDILLLYETSTRDTDRLKIINYNVYTTNRQNQNCAGAAICIRKDINARIEDFHPQQKFSTITCRAFSSLEKFYLYKI